MHCEKAIELLRHPQEFGAIASQYLPYVSILPVFAALQHESRRSHLTIASSTRSAKFAIGTGRASSRTAIRARSSQPRPRTIRTSKRGWRRRTPRQGLSASSRRRFRSLDLRKETKRGTSVYNGIFNLLVLGGARDWMTGNVPQYGDLDDHHIVPQELGEGRTKLGSLIDSILNRTPLTADTNRNVISDRLPNAYLPELIAAERRDDVRATLESHFISPAAFDVLLRDPSRRTTSRRSSSSGNARSRTLSRTCSSRSDSISPRTARARSPDRSDRVTASCNCRCRRRSRRDSDPRAVRQKASDRVQQKARKNPAFESDGYLALPGILEFFDLRELQDTIVNKLLWPEFQTRFGTPQQLEIRFNQLGELRNTLRHTRTVDEITRKDGEAALAWFENATA